MSSDYYFRKWKEILAKLVTLVKFDIDCQENKVHDKTLCQATRRWTAILGNYIVLYNELINVVHENLQMQKTEFFDRIIQRLLERITELKTQLHKIEKSNVQFLCPICDFLLTTNDADIDKIPLNEERPKHIQDAIYNVFFNARIARETEENPVEEAAIEKIVNWWETEDENENNSQEHNPNITEPEIPEEMRMATYYVNLIKATERTRQVTRQNIKKKCFRERWEKELKGTLNPPARFEIRNKSAKLIQKVIRKYFENRKEKIKNHKLGEIIGLCFSYEDNLYKHREIEKQYSSRSNLRQPYKDQWIQDRQEMKEDYLRRKRDVLAEDFRDQIREWFLEWFSTIQFIHSIPKNPADIFTGELAAPNDWMEQYEEYLKQKRLNPNKKNYSKQAKREEQRQLLRQKKEEFKLKRREELLLRKMMQNPSIHPGYHYPISKTTDLLLNEIKYYHVVWNNYDERNIIETKEKHLREFDYENIIKEAKLEVLTQVIDDMQHEFHKLKHALKLDYAANEEEMPVEFDCPKRKREKKKKTNTKKDIWNDTVLQKLENLVVKKVMVEYPHTQLQDFVGDPNFAGSSLRCQIKTAPPYNYEFRSLMWEECMKSRKGLNKILLVGPKGSGKTQLVHALASLNDAVLFILNLQKLKSVDINADYLNSFITDVITCAKAVQPTVINITHTQKLFYKKVPPDEKRLDVKLVESYFVQKLLKKINSTDKITIIGTCSDPWLANAHHLLHYFPHVFLLPNTYHSVVVKLLKDWVKRNKVIPRDFNTSSLAQVLQGYSFGYLQQKLEQFLTSDRIVKIAAHGLTPTEVHNFVIEDGTQEKVDYDKYLQWYSTHTHWGIREKKHQDAMLDFQEAVRKFNANLEKKRLQAESASPSYAAL